MFRQFLVSDEGNFAVVFAVAMVPVLGAVAGVADYVSVSNKAAKLQDSLDAAALTIATEYYSGMSQGELEEIGLRYFQNNVDPTYTGPDEFDYDHAFNAEAIKQGQEDYILVRSTITHDGLIGSIDWTAERESLVRIEPGQPACVLALDPEASPAIKLQGSAHIDMKGCRLAANSEADDSITRLGAARLVAECVHTSGGTNGLEPSSRVELECAAPLENQYPTQDPLADLDPPDYGACTSMPKTKEKTLSPGTYCDETFSGDITLEPGEYLLRGGRVNLGGNGSLVGAGVTLFLMEDAEFGVNGNEVVRLSPPESGDYAGIAIYQQRGNTSGLRINGGSDSEISGFLYAPSAHVFYAGNATVATEKCLRIVGNTIELIGNSDVSIDCRGVFGDRAMNAGRSMIIVQ